MDQEARINALEKKVAELEKVLQERPGKTEVRIISSVVTDKENLQALADYLNETILPRLNLVINEVNYLRREVDSRSSEVVYPVPPS